MGSEIQFKGYEQDQGQLFPAHLAEALDPSDPVFFISDLVEGLRLEVFERRYAAMGEHAYPPRLLLKLWLFGAIVGVYSGREMAQRLRWDLRFRYLAGGLYPDFRTINRFRVRHREEFAEVFRQTVRAARASGLGKLGRVAIDGTKIRANTSRHKAMSHQRMQPRGTYPPIHIPLRFAHQGEHHNGQHPPIIDLATWEAVRAQLASQAPPSGTAGARCSSPSPLRGKLFDETGIGLTPKHAVKNGKRYRYYVSRTLASGGDTASPRAVDQIWRLPAREIERLVSDSVKKLLSDQAELTLRAREAGVEESRIAELLTNVSRWDGEPLELIHRVDLGAGEIVILVDLRDLLKGDPTRIRYTVPTTIRRRGVEMRLVIGGFPGESRTSGLDPALIKAIARSHQWFDDLVSGRVRSLVEIAKAERVTDRYVGRLLPLAFLAPDIIASVLTGTQPVQLTAEMLTKRADLPLDWEEQRYLLGFNRHL